MEKPVDRESWWHHWQWRHEATPPTVLLDRLLPRDVYRPLTGYVKPGLDPQPAADSNCRAAALPAALALFCVWMQSGTNALSLQGGRADTATVREVAQACHGVATGIGSGQGGAAQIRVLWL